MTRFPGFDSLRLLAATAVIYCHAFIILRQPSAEPDLFERVTYDLAEYGVYTFFIISGFLLARSLAANSDPIVYSVNRILRILPGFVLYTCVVGFVIGPLLTSMDRGAYFADPRVYGLFRWGLESLSDSTLPGVFAYDGRFAGVLNGSLWSLRYEALSYILLLALWSLFRSAEPVAAVMTVLSAVVWLSPSASSRLASLAYTLPYFSGGVLMHVVYTRVGVTTGGAVLSAIVFVLVALLGWPGLAYAVAGAYVVVFLGERANPLSRLVGRTGDLSYGVYLYGWPIEQALVQVTRVRSPWMLFAAATLITIVFAAVSYHAVEKHAMRWRRAVSNRLEQVVDALVRWLGSAAGPAQLAARGVFIVAAGAILLAPRQWWFVLESVGILTTASAAAFVLSGLALRRTCRFVDGSTDAAS
jgi:peptidoglycan/LPS O-acetylase OafA/YrhL